MSVSDSRRHMAEKDKINFLNSYHYLSRTSLKISYTLSCDSQTSSTQCVPPIFQGIQLELGRLLSKMNPYCGRTFSPIPLIKSGPSSAIKTLCKHLNDTQYFLFTDSNLGRLSASTAASRAKYVSRRGAIKRILTPWEVHPSWTGVLVNGDLS